MKQYLDLVDTVLSNGIKKTNRTGVDTLMYFGYHYKVNLDKGFALLTTKKVFFNEWSKTKHPDLRKKNVKNVRPRYLNASERKLV